MGSITTWMRLEPHSRSAEMEAGLEMRIHDPLWMLARQWQFGEFQGEDAGTPVWATLNRIENHIELYLPGAVTGHKESDVREYSPNVPLEFLVEAETPLAKDAMKANLRLAVEAGQQFLRLLGESLAQTYREQLIEKLGIQTDERPAMDADSQAYLELVAGRAIDGARLLKQIQDSVPASDVATQLVFGSTDTQAAGEAIAAWLKWCQETIGPTESSTPRSSWNPERMEYACALAAPADTGNGQIVLTAEEYPGGYLDWYSFDAGTTKALEKAVKAEPKTSTSATIPTSMNFRGMPAHRLWEFEDAQVRFGAMQAAPTDLARLLLIEFFMQYGNDFFTIPIELDEGALHLVTELKIINTFGEETKPQPLANETWRMFTLTDYGAATKLPAGTLFLPPVIGQHLASSPIEEVHLLRDEMANMAWAIERIVESPCGLPLNRYEDYQAKRQLNEEQDQPIAEGTLRYKLDTWDTVPDYWIPLLPVKPSVGKSPMRLNCPDLPKSERCKGLLLSELPPATSTSQLFDEEVPRGGAHITRIHQYTRWYDNGLFAWIGREKRPGRGEGFSGLRFDIVEVVKAS